MSNIASLLDSRKKIFFKYFSSLEHPLKEAIITLLLTSDYAERQIDLLQNLVKKDDCLSRLSFQDYQNRITKLTATSFPEMTKALRQFRNYHFLRLLIREIAKLATTEETMHAWSFCADALILKTINFCEALLEAKYGVPIEEHSGAKAALYVLALGKLGGNELNYSSDIDLIFAYSAAGFTSGEKSISNIDFYTELVQIFIQLMQNITPAGFVFRVDLRLRPNGDSGALVSSLASMETYYQEQGRDWERYAMVKARLISASGKAEPWFKRIIRPFTYRRYVDFSVIESLRSMKAMIEREVQLSHFDSDIKRGRGGIREIEFIIQNIQLIRGGRMPSLCQTSTLAALAAIRKEKLFPHCSFLKKAYLFLRKLENYLQANSDQQTHSLPKEKLKQAQLALLMNSPSWKVLFIKLEEVQNRVSTLFHSILSKVDYHEDSQRLLISQLSSIWQGHVEPSMAKNLLASFGYQEAEDCYLLIHSFRHSHRCRRLTQALRLRLDKLMTSLLIELCSVKNTRKVLFSLISLLENILSRSVYLALLTENPPVLRELIHWFSLSPFITSLIVDYPFLLEYLLAEKKDWRCSSKKQLQLSLKELVSYSNEPELLEDQLRQFKLSQWLLAARAELSGSVTAIRVGKFLADLAEVIVKQVTVLAYEHLVSRSTNLKKIKGQFSILAYGKLGSRELNYDSDLDLVFIHRNLEDEHLVTRLMQKIMHMLTTNSQFGRLYTVDTRLRPSGEAGLLVSTESAFINYQQSHAWAWEHQALIRARLLVYSKSMRFLFWDLKKTIFSRKRDKSELAKDVKLMLEKLSQVYKHPTIKYQAGGLLELEFLIQYLVLSNPRFLGKTTHSLNLISLLKNSENIKKSEWQLLVKAYRTYHKILHQQILSQEKPRVPKNIQEKLSEISNIIFGQEGK